MLYFCQSYHKQNRMCEKFHEESLLANFVFWAGLLRYINTVARIASGVCV